MKLKVLVVRKQIDAKGNKIGQMAMGQYLKSQ